MDSPSSHRTSPPKVSPHKHQKPSTTELLSSAKMVAEAAKFTVNHETDKVDKAKVAGAAADLLGAASHYGKLEDKSFGKYLHQAEDYLHKYHSSHSSPTFTSSGHKNNSAHLPSASPHKSGADHGGHSGSGGYGDYLKMAQGFLKKH